MRAFTFGAGAALAVAALLGGCASAVDQGAGASDEPGSPSAPAAARTPGAADGTYLLGGLDTDQPCTATLAEAPRLSSLGIALQEVADLTLDPEELGLTGDDWYRSSEFTDNYQYTVTDPDACDVARRYGRVTGHQQRAFPASEESTYTQVQIDVALFQTPQGADGWLDWFAEPSGDDAAAGPPPTRTIEQVADLGERALLITRSDAESEGSIVILRRGRIVGDVYVWADAGEEPVLDVREVARRLDERIQSTAQTGQPVDIVATMTAPLPLSAWGDDFADWTWDWAGYGGGRDNATFLESTSNPEQAQALIEEHGRLAGHQATFGSPSGPGWIATGTTTYRDAAGAQGAMDRIVGDKLKGVGGSASPAEEFDVPGVPDAVGLAQTTDRELVTDVYFVRGPLLARTFRVQQSAPDDADDRALVSDMAEQFAERLDTVLGGGQ